MFAEEFRHNKFRSLEISIDDVMVPVPEAAKVEAPVEIIPIGRTYLHLLYLSLQSSNE